MHVLVASNLPKHVSACYTELTAKLTMLTAYDQDRAVHHVYVCKNYSWHR